MKKIFCLLLTLALLWAALPALAADTAELGKPFQDFTVTTIDGEDFTLSEALKTHEAVYVNLFATWCPPCEREFPFMQMAYEEYSGRVAVIAVSIEQNDTPDKLRAYRENHGLTLPMAPAGSTWMSQYAQAVSIPVSLMIDRFGSLTLRHVGALADLDGFRRMFDAFLGEGYTKTRTYQSIPSAALTIEFPSDEELNEALNPEGGAIAFTSDPAKRDYPFMPARQDGKTGVSPLNTDKAQSVASVQAAFSAEAGDVLAFDLRYDLAMGSNYLNVELDGMLVKQFMGASEGRTWALALSEGEHEVRFVYDQWAPQETGAPFLSRVRLLTGQEAEAVLAALPVYPTFETADILADDGVNGYFEYMGQPVLKGCVLNGDTVGLEMRISAGLDPECVLFADTAKPDDILALSDLLTADGAAYRYQISLEGENHYAAAIMEAFQPPMTVQLLVMRGESGVEQVIGLYAQRGYALTWVPEQTQAEETEATYTVRVIDQNGDPVPGAYLNFCTDDSCMLTQADENGVITFVGEPMIYHLQILMLPDGYSFDPAFEAYTGLHTSEMTVTVHKD